jgi:hypothetical protein
MNIKLVFIIVVLFSITASCVGMGGKEVEKDRMSRLMPWMEHANKR